MYVRISAYTQPLFLKLHLILSPAQCRCYLCIILIAYMLIVIGVQVQVVVQGSSAANCQRANADSHRKLPGSVCWAAIGADEQIWAEPMSSSELVQSAGGGTISASVTVNAIKAPRRRHAWYCLMVLLMVWNVSKGNYSLAIVLPILILALMWSMDYLDDYKIVA